MSYTCYLGGALWPTPEKLQVKIKGKNKTLVLLCTAPDCTDSTKRPPGRKYRVLGGEASRKRRLSSFDLDALVVVKIDVSVDHLIGF